MWTVHDNFFSGMSLPSVVGGNFHKSNNENGKRKIDGQIWKS